MIKAVDPSALVVGPEEWGWSGYLLQRLRSAVRQHAWLEHRCPIAAITAARTTCPGCSTNCARTTSTTGQRLLDVFTVHYYPQGGEFSDDVSTAMQLRRNRSTRSLWDPELRR